MKKRNLLICALAIIAIVIILVITLPPQMPQTNTLADKCCYECAAAFEQSPAGVGPQATQCGEFTTGAELSEECVALFAEKPMTVSECGVFSARYE